MSLTDLPVHSDLIGALRQQVEASTGWRWLELSCSLATGRGDALSDIDVGIGHDVDVDQLSEKGTALVEAIGTPLDVLFHSEASWPAGITRLAVEYDVGVQLDLVLMPAGHRPGLPDGSLSLVDKDGWLNERWTPPVASATREQAREWAMQGWWALSNTAKYLRRQSLFEAVGSLSEARVQALRLFAVGQEIPYPSFGLTSLLDFEPFELPHRLGGTYSMPNDPAEVLEAALALAELLDVAATGAGRSLGADLATPWQRAAEVRLESAGSTLETR